MLLFKFFDKAFGRISTTKTKSRWRLRRLHSKPANRIREIKITRPRDQRVMWLYGRKLLIVCNHPARFGGHIYCGGGGKMFLLYHVTSRDHVFKGLCDLMDWSFFKLVTTLPSLVAINLVVVIQQLNYFTWPCKTMRSKDLVTLWKPTLHCISQPCQNWYP